MRSFFRTAFALTCAVLSISATPPLRGLDVQLQPAILDGAFIAIDVAVGFRGEADGETVLDLPDAWGGEDDFWRAIQGLRVEGAHEQPGTDEAHRVLRHAPGAAIVVRYRIVQETEGAPIARARNPYRPIVQPSYFHLLGNAIIATPAEIDLRAPARFSLTGMPAGAAFASDAGHPGLTVKGVIESVMVGGDFRVIDAGGGARLAIRGAWPISDADWRDRVARIGAAQRAYWGAPQQPYLVTILPLAGEPGSKSVGGTGRDDGFAFFATTNAEAEVVQRILGHEMMHTWIPQRLGGLPEADEAADYWFSEGFTDWASWRVNVRSGLWSPEQFTEAFNEAIAAYDLSPARNAPNAQVAAGFWRDEALQKLPYQRGMLVATLWDDRIRRASGGDRDLDDVVMKMQEMARARRDITAVQFLPRTMQRAGGVEIGVDLTQLIAEGGAVALPADVFAPCGAIVAKESTAWARGFDFDATQRAGWVVQGVTDDSAAWRAGLRNGMRLRQWSEDSAARDPGKPVTAGVDDGGVRRDITWLPTDGSKRLVRRLELAQDMSSAQRSACAKRLAGVRQ